MGSIEPMGPSVFIKTFGNTPFLRLIDFLIESRDLDYSLPEIAQNTELSPQMFKKLWRELEQKNFVIQTRVLNSVPLFKINKDNIVVQKLIELDNVLCMEAFEMMV